jgi:hypothetical protein
LAQTLQKFSRLDEERDSKERTELKELVVHLTWNFTSQLNKALLSTIRSTSVVPFELVSSKEDRLSLAAQALGRRQPVDFLRLRFFSSDFRVNLPAKFKIAQFGVDKTNDTPFCALFRSIQQRVGMHQDDVRMGSFNLHKVR